MFLVDITFVDMRKITPELTEQHRKHLECEYHANRLMFGGRKTPRTGGVLISKHKIRSELTHVMESDPFIKSGAASYSITEFTPVMASQDYLDILNE